MAAAVGLGERAEGLRQPARALAGVVLQQAADALRAEQLGRAGRRWPCLRETVRVEQQAIAGRKGHRSLDEPEVGGDAQWEARMLLERRARPEVDRRRVAGGRPRERAGARIDHHAQQRHERLRDARPLEQRLVAELQQPPGAALVLREGAERRAQERRAARGDDALARHVADEDRRAAVGDRHDEVEVTGDALLRGDVARRDLQSRPRRDRRRHQRPLDRPQLLQLRGATACRAARAADQQGAHEPQADHQPERPAQELRPARALTVRHGAEPQAHAVGLGHDRREEHVVAMLPAPVRRLAGQLREPPGGRPAKRGDAAAQPALAVAELRIVEPGDRSAPGPATVAQHPAEASGRGLPGQDVPAYVHVAIAARQLLEPGVGDREARFKRAQDGLQPARRRDGLRRLDGEDRGGDNGRRREQGDGSQPPTAMRRVGHEGIVPGREGRGLRDLAPGGTRPRTPTCATSQLSFGVCPVEPARRPLHWGGPPREPEHGGFVKTQTSNGARRATQLIAGALAACAVLPASALAAEPPAPGHLIHVLPTRDAIVARGYVADVPAIVQVRRRNPETGLLELVSRSAPIVPADDPDTPEFDGIVQVNRPAGGCWNDVTPDLRPGDKVRVLQRERPTDETEAAVLISDDQTTVANVTTGRPSVVRGATSATIVLKGTAQRLDGQGRPLAAQIPRSQLDASLVSPRDPFAATGRPRLRATLRYDQPGSTTNFGWTATVTIPLADADRAGAAQARITWLGRTPEIAVERTISENHPALTGGPRRPCVAPRGGGGGAGGAPAGIIDDLAGADLVELD